MQDCDQLHVVHKASIVWEDAPAPKWPEDGAATHCACGQEIEYCHVVHELHWQDDKTGGAAAKPIKLAIPPTTTQTPMR